LCAFGICSGLPADLLALVLGPGAAPAAEITATAAHAAAAAADVHEFVRPQSKLRHPADVFVGSADPDFLSFQLRTDLTECESETHYKLRMQQQSDEKMIK
jgi:hypothetical protein